MIGQEVVALSSDWKGLGWMLGSIYSLKVWSDIGTGFPVKWWSHCPWNYGTGEHSLVDTVDMAGMG